MKSVTLKITLLLALFFFISPNVNAIEKESKVEGNNVTKEYVEKDSKKQKEIKKKKLRFKDKVKLIKQLRKLKKESKKQGKKADVPMILLVILAILLPPLAVWLYSEDVTKLVISIILTLLFWLPGIIYALLVLFDVV